MTYRIGLALFLFAGCQLTGPSKTTVSLVRGGESFGECLGYCQRTVEIDSNEIRHFEIASFGTDPTLPDRMQTRQTAPEQWSRLSALTSEDTFAALDSVYGCPDCADGGAEWIEIQFADEIYRVTFEYNNAPGVISALADSLRAVRHSFTYN